MVLTPKSVLKLIGKTVATHIEMNNKGRKIKVASLIDHPFLYCK